VYSRNNTRIDVIVLTGNTAIAIGNNKRVAEGRSISD